MDRKFLETLRGSGIFQVKRLLKSGGSYAFTIPKALTELISTEVAGDYWVSYEMTEEGKLTIGPLALGDIEKFQEYIGES